MIWRFSKSSLETLHHIWIVLWMISSAFLIATTCALIQLNVKPRRLTFLIIIVAPGARVKSFKLLGVYISEDLTWGVHCNYIIKKANRRLCALRTLKRCGVPTSDLITVYCSLIRSVIEYASAVFANLPKYLSDALEGIQKRALRIILPNLHYDEALILSALPSLEDRRAAACESFMRTKPSNPVFGLAMSGRVNTVHSYSLRSCRNYNNKMCKTKRLSEFVSAKYLDFLS